MHTYDTIVNMSALTKAEKYLRKDEHRISTYDLKQKLFIENIKKRKCENCHKSRWLKKRIPLELHHKNGDKYDNRIINLQILCPNCHALTDTYRKQKKK